MKNKLAILTLLLTSTCWAQDEQWAVDIGAGDFNADKGDLPQTKVVSIGYQEDLWDAVKQRYTGGAWFDNSGCGRKSSLFASAQLGFEVVNNGWVGGVYTGGSLISSPDVVLGGPFQFLSTARYGMQDRQSNYIGVFYEHFSSAGLELPNDGRNIMGLEIRF